MMYGTVVIGFLVDSYGFGVDFTTTQIVGASIVLCFNVYVIVAKLMTEK